jgi:hypothetical protein
MNQDTASPSMETKNTTKTRIDGVGKRCERCGVLLCSDKASLKEIVVNVGCVALLVFLLAPVIYVSSVWLEEHVHQFFRVPVWHEPTDWFEPRNLVAGKR